MLSSRFRPKPLDKTDQEVQQNLLMPSLGTVFNVQEDPRFFVAGEPPRIKRNKKKNPRRAEIAKTKLLKRMNHIFSNWQGLSSNGLQLSFGDDDEVMAESTPFPIDAVFTWVEDTPRHAEKRKFFGANIPADNGKNRYSDHDELKFSIRSIYKHAPWFRKIFIIVDDEQCPSWLSEQSALAPVPTIVVPHSFIYKDFLDHLPTFNSQSIECHLHKIPGLSENFVYFNDDMFIGARVSWSHFFTAEGHPKYSFTGFVRRGPRTQGMSMHSVAWINNGKVLDRIFQTSAGTLRKYPSHQGVPMLKQSFVDAWSLPLLRKYLTITSASRFRNVDNMYLVGFLCFWNLYRNTAREHSITSLYVDMEDSTDMFQVAKTILERRPLLMCFNDRLGRKRSRNSLLLKAILENLFPKRSPVEKPEASTMITEKGTLDKKY